MKNFLTARLCASLLALGIFAVHALATEVVPVLQTKTETYQNVTVISRTVTHVFVQHSRGVANIKVAELNAQTLTALGYGRNDEAVRVVNAANPSDATGAATENSTNRLAVISASLSGALGKLKTRLGPDAQVPDFKNINRNVVLAVLGGIVLAYFFFCYCSMLICKKTGNEPGILIWLPVLQIFPLLRAASMSGWWFLAMFVPLLNLVASLIWCFKITAARGKGIFTAILLILPVTNFFAFLYLAFSEAAGASNAGHSPRKSMQTEPLPA